MKHFSEQIWIDFVRGTGQAKANQEIESHLASGCPDCVPVRSLWQQVYSIATSEPGFTPPDHIVRMVKHELATRHVPEPSPWVLAQLVFDSLTRPLPVGVRSGVSDTRQMLFDAEGTMVDLVLEIHPQSNTVTLAGQVVDKDRTRVLPREVSVVSWTEGGQPLAEARANEFGEFQLEFAVQERLRLSVEIVGCKPIRIPPLNLTPTQMRPVTDPTKQHY